MFSIFSGIRFARKLLEAPGRFSIGAFRAVGGGFKPARRRVARNASSPLGREAGLRKDPFIAL
jgi:hypothetical protein